MRTSTAQEDRIIDGRSRSVHLRVFVDSDGAGTFVNLSSLRGFDWVKDVTIRDDASSPVATARVTLVRDQYQLSLASLVGTSVFNVGQPMIEVSREIFIEAALLPQDAVPVESDYEEQFRGHIDIVDWGGSSSTMSLQCRDQGGVLVDGFVESQTKYGDGAKFMEVVIQDILNDAAPAGFEWIGVALTLFTPVTTSFAINEYLQQKMPLMTAFRTLAGLIGWQCRYRWDNGTSTFRLTLYEPDRAVSVAQRVFTADQYYDISNVTVSRADIRNAVKVIYDDAGALTFVERTDAASVTRYGRRFMEIALGQAFDINTITEAEDLGDAALSDLAEPDTTQSVVMPYYPKVQVGDYYGFASNDIHYTSQQDLAVVAYEHKFPSGGEVLTTLQVRGKPTIGVDRWLEVDARTGNAPAADEFPPTAIINANITESAGVGSYRLKLDDILDPDWAVTELYLDTSSIPKPTFPTKPNVLLLHATGRQSSFDITGLIPGQDYFGLALAIDVRGNWDALVSFQFTATERVGPFHENGDGQQDQLLRNNDFNIFTKGVGVAPDFWENVAGTTWLTDFAVGTGKTGGSAIEFFYTGTTNEPEIESNLIPFTGDDVIRIGCVAKGSGANPDENIRIRAEYFDISFVSTGSLTLTSSLTTSFRNFLTSAKAVPAGTVWVKLKLAPSSGDGTSFTMTVDKAVVKRDESIGSASDLIAAALPVVYTKVEFSNIITEEGVDFVDTGGAGTDDSCDIIHPGLYMLQGFCRSNDTILPNDNYDIGIKLLVNGGVIGEEVVSADINGDAIARLTLFASLDEGDRVTIEHTQGNAPTPAQIFNVATTLNLQQITRLDI